MLQTILIVIYAFCGGIVVIALSAFFLHRRFSRAGILVKMVEEWDNTYPTDHYTILRDHITQVYDNRLIEKVQKRFILTSTEAKQIIAAARRGGYDSVSDCWKVLSWNEEGTYDPDYRNPL